MSTTPGNVNGEHDGPQPFNDLWFSDGSVVLRTESYLFRVHKSILARESTVFADMFAFPANAGHDRSQDFGEQYEGLAVVPLIGDDETAVIHLLKLIYQTNYSKVDDILLETPCCLGLFKLSIKYHFPGLEQTFKNQLAVAFPLSRMAFLQEQSIKLRRAVLLHDNIFGFLNVAREMGMSEILPALFYCCSLYSVCAVLAKELAPPITELLLAGREKLKFHIFDAISKKMELYALGIAGCKVAPHCRVSVLLQACNLKCQSQTDTLASDGADFFTLNIFDEAPPTTSLCNTCKSGLTAVVGSVRDSVWNLLPQVFELS